MVPLAQQLNGALRRLPSWAVYLAGTVPFLWLVWRGVTDALGADPVREVEDSLGKTALWFLVGGLAVTPARRFLGVNLLRYRRALGLLGFAYALLHVTSWFTLDMGLLWRQALNDLWFRRYLLFGTAALVLLVPLAATSNNASIRRLGSDWRRLHRLVYPAVALGVIHYLWQMKVISGEGWIWAGIATALLGMRLLPSRR